MLILTHVGKQIELTRKHVSDMFYNAELEHEIRKCQDGLEWAFVRDGDREKYLEKVIKETNKKRYHHTPVEGCAKRGKVSTLSTML